MEDTPQHTGWVGVTFEIPTEAIPGTYDVRFAVWSEDGAQEYDSMMKSGWLELILPSECTVTIISGPEANPATVNSNESTQLSVSATDSAGHSISYRWTATGGNFDNANSQNPTWYAPQNTGSSIQYYTLTVIATCSGGKTASGSVQVGVRPEKVAPSVSTCDASNLGSTSATLNGYLDSTGGLDCLVWFEYGETTSYGNSTTQVSKSSPGSFSASIFDLTPGITYHFRAYASNSKGTVCGEYEIFTTRPVSTSVSCFDGQICYSSKEEAVAHVPDHVVPKECFVWNDGPPSHPWRVIPGHGCAHWVAHQLGIRMGATCYDGYSIRIRDVIAGRAEVGIKSCKVGDIWTNSDETHCGIVRQLGDGKVLVEHDSSAEGGVVMNWFSSGKCWSECPIPEAEVIPGVSAGNLWEYYSAWGKELPPLPERAKMYEALGLGSASDYAGTPQQNTQLLDVFKQRRICPSTAAEVGWVAPATTVAQLIQREATGTVPVTVDGNLYVILTLKNRIDPITLEVVLGSGATKVYVDAENYPVSEPDIAQKIGLIDDAQRWQKGAGSPKSISERIMHLWDGWYAYEQLKVWQFPKDLLAKAPAIFIRAYVSGGALTLEDFADFAADAVTLYVELFTDPIRLVEVAIEQDLWDADANYFAARKIALRDGIADYETAYTYLRHFLEGAKCYEEPANYLLAEIGDINKGMGKEFVDYFIDVANEISGRYYGNVREARGRLMEIIQITQYMRMKNTGATIVEEYLSKLLGVAPYTLELAQSPRLAVEVHSPVELRVYDSQQRVTGVVNGEERNEIPYSVYHDNSVTIFSPTNFYRYEVVGTSEGSYDLAVTIIAEETNTFSLTKVPTSTKTMHQYTIDWDTLAKGKKGVTMKIDSDGDGTFEDIKYLGQEGVGFSWVWVALAGLSGLVGVLVGAFMVRRRMSRKQAA